MRILNILIALLIISISPLAHASNLMPNHYYAISTVKAPGDADGDFLIRLTSPASMTGCLNIEKPEISIIDAGAVLYMTIEEGNVQMKEKKRYGQFDCDLKAGPSYAEIELNKYELEEKGTYKIDIKSKQSGRVFDIEVKTGDNFVELDTKLETTYAPPSVEREKVLKHWFYPDNTVIVFTHGMKQDEELARKAGNIAASKGLTPLDTILEGFENPEGKLYFVDTKDVLKDQLGKNNTITIGGIPKKENYYTASGSSQRETTQPVMTRRPSIHE